MQFIPSIQRILCLARIRHTFRSASDREFIDYVMDHIRERKLYKKQIWRMRVCRYCGKTSIKIQ